MDDNRLDKELRKIHKSSMYMCLTTKLLLLVVSITVSVTAIQIGKNDLLWVAVTLAVISLLLLGAMILYSKASEDTYNMWEYIVLTMDAAIVVTILFLLGSLYGCIG